MLELAQQSRLQDDIEALFDGARINNTENRPALHTLLRASGSHGMDAEFEQVAASRALMRQWSERLNGGRQTGFSGATITDVVNIGIGGSDLGPRLVTEALRPFHGNINCHYVANVDPADLQDTLVELDPASTLFIVCSKSFRTEETLANGLAARALDAGRRGQSTGDLDKHFLAVPPTCRPPQEFGISRRQLPADVGLGGGALFGVVRRRPELCHRGRLGALRRIPGRRRGHGRAFSQQRPGCQYAAAA